MKNAFIILCRDNDKNGNPDAETIARLETAKEHLDEASCIVLAGHDRHNASMKRWLSENTDAKLPIYCGIAYDTIGQAVFTAPVTHALGIKKLTVITSEYHLPRTRAIFEKVHNACCDLSFIGAKHPVENLEAIVKHEQESLELFNQKFANATTLFDFMAILFDHHPLYQHITLAKADHYPESQDSKHIWEWRNDPITRQMSRTTDAIPWEKHKEWYARAAKDPKKAILMAYVNGIPACMVRFDYIQNDYAEININMNPAMRGKGLGKPILATACRHGFDTLKLSRIYAEIKPENAPSVRIFEGTGFVFQGMKEGLRTYNLMRGGRKQ